MDDGLKLVSSVHRDAAFNRFGETDETRSVKLKLLAEAVQLLPYHSIFDSTPSNLIKYLRGQQFDVKRATKVIESLIDFKIKNPKLTNDLTTNEFTQFISIVHILNARDVDNRVVVFIKTSKFLEICVTGLLESQQLALSRLNYFVNNQVAHNIDAQIYGVVRIFSFSEISLAQARVFRRIAPLSQVAQNMNFLNYCSPVQLHKIYYFEEPFYVRWAWNVGKHLISSEFGRKISFNGTQFHVLCHVIPQDQWRYMPTWVGGEYNLEANSAGRSGVGSIVVYHTIPSGGTGVSEEEKREEPGANQPVPNQLVPNQLHIQMPPQQQQVAPAPVIEGNVGRRGWFGGNRNNRIIPVDNDDIIQQ